jgi:hypothetical protein
LGIRIVIGGKSYADGYTVIWRDPPIMSRRSDRRKAFPDTYSLSWAPSDDCDWVRVVHRIGLCVPLEISSATSKAVFWKSASSTVVNQAYVLGLFGGERLQIKT